MKLFFLLLLLCMEEWTASTTKVATSDKPVFADPVPFTPEYHICSSRMIDPSAPLLRNNGVWHLFEDVGGWSHYQSRDLLHWSAAENTGFAEMTGSISVTPAGTYAFWPNGPVFSRSEALDVNLTKWGPHKTVVKPPDGVGKLQDPARALKMADGDWYLAGACAVHGAKFAAICLWRASDETLSSFVPAGGPIRPDGTGVFLPISKTYGAVDGNGVFHNVSYPLRGLDVGCPDLFPFGDKYAVLATYGGTPGKHMQDQWWVGDIINNTFMPEQTGLLDYGNLFAAKTGTTEQQSGSARRVVFGFPGWTQTTKPKQAPQCLQLPRELTFSADDHWMLISPVPELATLRKSRAPEESAGIETSSTLAIGSQVELRMSCTWASSGVVGMDVLATPDGAEYTRITYNFQQQLLFVDQRACCGPPPGNGVVQSGPLALKQGIAAELVVFVDGYLVEVYLNNRTVITALVAPNATTAAPADRRAFMYNPNGVQCHTSSWQLSLDNGVGAIGEGVSGHYVYV